MSAADPARPVERPHGHELVSRILAGDRSAEEELVDRYSRGVSVLLSHNVNDRSVVDDLHQETFRIALEKIRRGDVREPEKLSGFVCAVARNLAIEHFRRGAAANRSATTDAAATVTDPAPGPLELLLRSENAQMVRQVLDEVTPARYRGVLYRYYVAEDDKEQICADLGMSSLQFNRVLHRARERYRELYVSMIKHPGSDSMG